jgi:two-component system response regulator (stage 0 sporulation protein A)
MKVNMDDECSRADILRQTTCHMIRLGFQARQRGYRYLREAVLIAYQEPETLTAVTKCLYPEVAKRYNTTDKHVERAIRNAIETAWNGKESEPFKTLFEKSYKNITTRPTNKEVIAKIAGLIRDTMESDK